MNIKEIKRQQIYVSMEITTTCNLNCPYCYVQYLNTDKVVKDSIWTILLYRLKKIKRDNPDKDLMFDFLGGEPLAVPQQYLDSKMQDILKLHQENIVDIFSITSNGLIFKDLSMMQEFKHAILALSIHSYKFNENFDKLYSNIEKYSELDINIFANFYIDSVLSEETKENILKLIKLLDSKNLKYRFIPIFTEEGLFDIFSCGLSKEVMFKYISSSFISNAKYHKKTFTCTPNVFDIGIHGEIRFSCAYNMKEHLNILKNDIPINKKVRCNEEFCTSYDGDKTNVKKHLKD